MVPNAHGAYPLQLNLHAETHLMLPISQLLSSHAPTYHLWMRKRRKRNTHPSEDSLPECSDIKVENTMEDNKMADTTEVVKINQKDVMEDMVEDITINRKVKINQKDVMEDMVEDITNNRKVRMSKKVLETIMDHQEFNHQ
jgi:hypothetical protein